MLSYTKFNRKPSERLAFKQLFPDQVLSFVRSKKIIVIIIIIKSNFFMGKGFEACFTFKQVLESLVPLFKAAF